MNENNDKQYHPIQMSNEHIITDLHINFFRL